MKNSGTAVRFVQKPTEALCLEAVRQWGWSLQYIKNQTPEICLEAVRQNGLALEYVNEQTPEVCLEAVKQKGSALKYVKNQTPEICLEAVKSNGRALEYAEEQTEELMLISLFGHYRFYEPYEIGCLDKKYEDQTDEIKLIYGLLKQWTYRFPSQQTIRSKLALNEINQEQSPYHVLEQLYMMG